MHVRMWMYAVGQTEGEGEEREAGNCKPTYFAKKKKKKKKKSNKETKQQY